MWICNSKVFWREVKRKRRIFGNFFSELMSLSSDKPLCSREASRHCTIFEDPWEQICEERMAQIQSLCIPRITRTTAKTLLRSQKLQGWLAQPQFLLSDLTATAQILKVHERNWLTRFRFEVLLRYSSCIASHQRVRTLRKPWVNLIRVRF